MTLTTHALVGAAAASLFPEHPYLAFAAGFASHLAVDAIPHWDYDVWLRSVRKSAIDPLERNFVLGRDFVRDLAIIGSDALLGALASLLIFSVWLFDVPPEVVLVGAGAGVFPDFLQVVYWKSRWLVLEPLQRLHLWLQWKEMKDMEPPLGILLQAGVVLAALALASLWL